MQSLGEARAVVSSRSGKDEVRPTENQSFSVRRHARKRFILLEKWAGGGGFDVSLLFWAWWLMMALW